MHMNNGERVRARDYIVSLAANGCYHFTSADAQRVLGVSPDAAKLALNRLRRQGHIATPARGFYVIVPPEYRVLKCLPADQFIPALMQRLGLSYYAGLLTAAQYHGAAHHRPQEFQVMVAHARRAIVCGTVRVAFIVRKNLAEIPVQSFNTPRGTVMVSTPEATAIDLVGYAQHAGGLDQVATLLAELAERIDPGKLVVAARTAPMPWAQRLGFLLELVDEGDRATALKSYVKTHAQQAASLLPAALRANAVRDKGWKLDINAEVEAEL